MQEQTIGSIVKEKREALRYSQAELAAMAGVTQATISGIESGNQTNVRIDNIRAIAKALNCRTIDLLPESDKKKSKPVSPKQPELFSDKDNS